MAKPTWSEGLADALQRALRLPGHPRKSTYSQLMRREVLMWKWEDGPEDGPDEGTPDDVGPVWLGIYEDDRYVSGETVNGGDWLTRAAAARLATENGWEIEYDD